MTPEEILAYWMLKSRDLIKIASTVPYRPSYLQSLNITTFKPITTTEVTVQVQAPGKLALIQTTERGGPIEQDTPKSGDLRVLPTFRLAKGATIRSHELRDVVMFGEGTVKKRIGAELAERFAAIDEDMTLTEEHMLMGAVQGIIMDADGTTPLLDCFTEFGAPARATINLDWANWTIGDARKFFNNLKREMTREMTGLSGRGKMIALCGDQAYDDLVTAPAVEKLYASHSGARELEKIGQAYESFPFAGIEWHNYRGTDDMTTIKIPDNEVRFFPAGVKDLFLDVRAPGETISDLSVKGKRRNPVMLRDKDRDFWMKAEQYTYPSYVCTRPGVLRKGVLV